MIRLANETDAEAVIDITKDIILSEKTTKFFVSSPNELPNDINKEQEKIRKSREKDNLYVVFEVVGNVVGFMVFNRYEHNRLHHTGAMGMGIREEYTNQGIGTQLIQYLIDWAKNKKT